MTTNLFEIGNHEKCNSSKSKNKFANRDSAMNCTTRIFSKLGYIIAILQVPSFVERAFDQHEEEITKSRKRLFLPVLPRTANSPNESVIFKNKKIVKSKTRVIYKNRAASILDDAIRLNGNIENLTREHNFKISDLSRFSERFKGGLKKVDLSGNTRKHNNC